VLSNADMLNSLREHNVRVLDQLLLERYGGKVCRGLAVELSHRRNLPDVRNLYFTLLLTYLRKDGKASEGSLQS
jgi:hypothetical protein